MRRRRERELNVSSPNKTDVRTLEQIKTLIDIERSEFIDPYGYENEQRARPLAPRNKMRRG